jgi:predicted dehydrogenase
VPAAPAAPLHLDNALHLREFKIHRFADVPATAREHITVETRRLVAEALGLPDVPPAVQRAFLSVLGSLIHDIGNLHGLFGPPQRVLHTTLWAEGRGIHTVLEYTGGLPAVCSWVDLPDLWEFTETLGVYGARERVIVSFPTGFSRGLPSVVTLHGMEANGHPWRKELAWHENPFKRELLHFHACVVERRPPETPGQAAISDIALVREIICAALR